MMRLSNVVLALGVAALLSGPALAQRQPGGGGRGGGGITQLLQNKSVQEELKLEKDQITKIEDATKKVREDNKDDYDKLRDRNTSREDRAAIQKKLTEANEKALKGILTDTQEKRLHQVQFQQRGLAVFQDEDVQKKLSLSSEQKEKLKTLADDLQKDIREVGGGGGGGGRGRPNPEAMTKIQGLRKEAATNAQKVLNDDQKKTFKDLSGEPFEIKFEGRQGGKPGGGKPGDKPRTDF
jgi:hypothetical protein